MSTTLGLDGADLAELVHALDDAGRDLPELRKGLRRAARVLADRPDGDRVDVTLLDAEVDTLRAILPAGHPLRRQLDPSPAATGIPLDGADLDALLAAVAAAPAPELEAAAELARAARRGVAAGERREPALVVLTAAELEPLVRVTRGPAPDLSSALEEALAEALGQPWEQATREQAPPPLRPAGDGELVRAEALATFGAHLGAVEGLTAAVRGCLEAGLRRPDVEGAVESALREAGA